MMTPRKPQAIHKGDTVGIIAPASAPLSQERIDKGAEYLERIGYRVKFAPNVRAVRGYLAGADRQRADDINRMFTDTSVRAIIAVRGGYGTPRVLDLLDYAAIRRNPKILVGYSDLTALQLAIYRKTGLVTFSGPMAGVEMFKGIDPFTEEHFWRMLTSTKKIGPVKNPDDRPFATLCKGKAEGRLLGGNLSLISSIIGTPYAPSFNDALLFFEEVEEECYRFDRMLCQLKLAGVFRDARGVLIGELTDVKPSDPSKPFLTKEEVLTDYFASLAKPVMTGLVYGHIARKLTMPVGTTAVMDASRRTLSFTEAAVA
ncbi:MAG TPA: LD-carboxypeptidase [Bacteroidota bacterium]|nr:LD-carboxypeptidase [Bacteroidota bacterium]